MRRASVIVIAAAVLVAGCVPSAETLTPTSASMPGSSVGAPSAPMTVRSISTNPRIRPDLTDLGGRPNKELARLVPAADEFADGMVIGGVDIIPDDGTGLGLHGQTDGQARPAQCLYSPFGKSYTQRPDGSDWNLYEAATGYYRDESLTRWVSVAVKRQRENSDVIALTADWIAGCGAYTLAFPSFAEPSNRNRAVVATFVPGPVVERVPTYRYTSRSSLLGDETRTLPPMPTEQSTTLLARVRSVVLVVSGSGDVASAELERLLRMTIRNAESAPR